MPIKDNRPISIQLADITSKLFNNCQAKEMRYATKHGVSIVEFRCLKILHESEELTVNQLAAKMSLTSSRITRIIDNLVSKELVHRVSSLNDRRIYNLSLTLKGNELAIKMIHDYTKIHENILNAIPSDYQKSMIHALINLNEAVEKWLKNK